MLDNLPLIKSLLLISFELRKKRNCEIRFKREKEWTIVWKSLFDGTIP